MLGFYRFISPCFMTCIFVFYFAKYTPIKYGNDYHYPLWGEVLGFMISASSMIWVPAYAIYYLWTTPGSLKERLRLGITPVINMRADAIIKSPKKEFELNLVDNVDKSNHA